MTIDTEHATEEETTERRTWSQNLKAIPSKTKKIMIICSIIALSAAWGTYSEMESSTEIQASNMVQPPANTYSNEKKEETTPNYKKIQAQWEEDMRVAAKLNGTTEMPLPPVIQPMETLEMSNEVIVTTPTDNTFEPDVPFVQTITYNDIPNEYPETPDREINENEVEDKFDVDVNAPALKAPGSGKIALIAKYVLDQEKVDRKPIKYGIHSTVELKPGEKPSNANDSNSTQNNIVSAGEIHFCKTTLNVNSDLMNRVQALCLKPPLANAVIQGRFTRQGELLSLHFDTLNINGKKVPIDAYAVDPTTASPAMATHVDRRIVSRNLVLIADTFLRGLQKATLLQSTVVQTPTSTQTVKRFSPTDLLVSGVGEVAGGFADKAQQYYNTPPTVTIEKDTPFGLWFVEPVQDPFVMAHK